MSYTPESIHAIVEYQRNYFMSGETLDVNFRIEQLKKLRRMVMDHQDAMTAALAEDLGRHKTEGFFCDVGPVIAEINEILEGIQRWARPETHFSGLTCFPSVTTKVYKMPYGVTLIISPFNFPFLLSLGVLAASLAGGNTAVIKASSKSEACTRVLQQMIAETFPSNYITVVDGGHDIADLCLDDAKISKWLSGAVRPHSEIRKYYSRNPNTQEELSITLKDAVFPGLFDENAAADQIYDLIVWDGSINPHQRDSLCALRNKPEDFISAVLIFGLTRRFRSTADGPADLSPDIGGYISGADIPRPCRNFFGRGEDIEQLDKALAEDGKVFLRGIAGIGKSELARAYAQHYRSKYTNILYIFYSGSLQSDIAGMVFSDDRPDDSTEKRFQNHLRFFKTLRPDTLLIIDNFNTTAEEEETLFEIMRLRCRVLFTTRSVFEEYRTCMLHEMDNENLMKLFLCYGDSSVSPETAEKIILAVHRHTLAVEMAARLTKKGLFSPEQLLEKLASERTAFSGTDRIQISKDDRLQKGTYNDQIRALFRLANLDKEKISVMCMMSMMPLTGIPAKKFAAWSQQGNMNTLNDLIESGFIQADDNLLRLHPLLQETVIAELQPSDTNCRPLMLFLTEFCITHISHLPDYDFVFFTTINIIKYAVHDDPDTYSLFLVCTISALQDIAKLPYVQMLDEELAKILPSQLSILQDENDSLQEPDIPFSTEQIAEAAIEYIESTETTRCTFLYKISLYVLACQSCRDMHDIRSALRMMDRAVILYKQYAQCIPPSQSLVLLSFRMEHARLLNDMFRPEKGLQLLLPYKQKIRTADIDPICKVEYFLTLALLTANSGHKKDAVKILANAAVLCSKELSKDDSDRTVFYFFYLFPTYISLINHMKPKEFYAANLPTYYIPQLQ